MKLFDLLHLNLYVLYHPMLVQMPFRTNKHGQASAVMHSMLQWHRGQARFSRLTGIRFIRYAMWWTEWSVILEIFWKLWCSSAELNVWKLAWYSSSSNCAIQSCHQSECDVSVCEHDINKYDMDISLVGSVDYKRVIIDHWPTMINMRMISDGDDHEEMLRRLSDPIYSMNQMRCK